VDEFKLRWGWPRWRRRWWDQTSLLRAGVRIQPDSRLNSVPTGTWTNHLSGLRLTAGSSRAGATVHKADGSTANAAAGFGNYFAG
jgi:hypothetical protein